MSNVIEDISDPALFSSISNPNLTLEVEKPQMESVHVDVSGSRKFLVKCAWPPLGMIKRNLPM